MASCDYHHCEICGCKTYYDSEIEYYDNTVISLCSSCNKTHEIIVVKRIIEKIEEKE